MKPSLNMKQTMPVQFLGVIQALVALGALFAFRGALVGWALMSGATFLAARLLLSEVKVSDVDLMLSSFVWLLK